MQAIRFFDKGVARLAEMPVADLKPGEALVRVRASGLCHTDIDVLHARYGTGAFPVVPGHEFAGEVVRTADTAGGIREGMRVAVDPNLSCGHCRACRRGLTNLCSDLKAYGVTQDGGFADYAVVRVDHLHDIGDMPYERAALAEPLACVLNGLEAAEIGRSPRLPETALIYGAGPIGLLLGLALQSAGVAHVAVADLNAYRLQFAEGLGFEAVEAGSSDLAARRHGFDLVADATGVPSVVEGMIDQVADGGTVMIFGVCAPDARIALSPFEIFRRQIRLSGSHSLNGNIPDALRILARDGERLSKLVSHRLPIADMLPFFAAKSQDPATMKVQFVAD